MRPILAPAQFLSLRHRMADSRGLDENTDLRRVLPRPVWRAALVMDGALRVFWDDLLGGTTEFAVRSRTPPTSEPSLRLLRRWEASSAQLLPGDHYSLVDGFASLLAWKAPGPSQISSAPSPASEIPATPRRKARRKPAPPQTARSWPFFRRHSAHGDFAGGGTFVR